MIRTCAQSTLRASSRLSAISPRLFLRAQSSNALTKTQPPFTFSKSGPSSVKYTSQHEWIAAHQDGTAFVGITKYAADALGDATYIELPEADSELEAGDSLGSVESVKSASEVYQPLAGTVLEGNESLNDTPQLINEDPMGEGWIAKVRLNDLADMNGEELMSLEQYEESLKEDH
ncbi:Glycine cleavage system H protein [Lachancea thermotolerans]|uniref:Glycine cleavage system H protein n=1 Tax=Lachancea thermotolerans (strain ATCC 56472 / CBS 6340 / NRRL Y-8284) TaxID=559295 RepID=C5DFY8_LACTC|nr:KLTH0D01012p [Lachancea thermotolerans CBS 6340]CAR22330.1 KLTH0D01012p [Lachancea thermotolerans CBS 6340]